MQELHFKIAVVQMKWAEYTMECFQWNDHIYHINKFHAHELSPYVCIDDFTFETRKKTHEKTSINQGNP